VARRGGFGGTPNSPVATYTAAASVGGGERLEGRRTEGGETDGYYGHSKKNTSKIKSEIHRKYMERECAAHISKCHLDDLDKHS
jgi:hypothetical protein